MSGYSTAALPGTAFTSSNNSRPLMGGNAVGTSLLGGGMSGGMSGGMG